MRCTSKQFTLCKSYLWQRYSRFTDFAIACRHQCRQTQHSIEILAWLDIQCELLLKAPARQESVEAESTLSEHHSALTLHRMCQTLLLMLHNPSVQFGVRVQFPNVRNFLHSFTSERFSPKKTREYGSPLLIEMDQCSYLQSEAL